MSSIIDPLDDNNNRDLNTLYEELQAAEKQQSEGHMLDGPSVMAELLC